MQTLRQAIEVRLGADAEHQIQLLQRRLRYAASAPGHREFPEPILRHHPREYIDEFHRINHLRFTGD